MTTAEVAVAVAVVMVALLLIRMLDKVEAAEDVGRRILCGNEAVPRFLSPAVLG